MTHTNATNTTRRSDARRPLRRAGTAALLTVVLAAGGCRIRNAEPEPELPPFDVEAALIDADALFDAGEYDEARVIFEKTIAVNPELPDGYLGVGDIHRAEGDLPAAADAYGSAADVAPQNYEAQYKHGLVLQLLSRLSESVGAYMRALTIQPDSFDANLNIATAYLQLGEPEAGVVFAINAVELDPRSGAARVNLAALYAALGEWQQAADQYQFADELTELTPNLQLTFADAQIRAGDVAGAIATLEGLVEDAPSGAAFERLGAARFKARDFAGAADAFRAGVDLDPTHYPAINGLAISRLNDFLRSGKRDRDARDEAVGYLRASLRLNPRQARVRELLSRFG